MRLLSILFVVLGLLVPPCLWGCGSNGGPTPDNAPSIGDPVSEFEATPAQSGPTEL